MSTLLNAKDVVNNPDFMLYRMDIDQAELHFLEVTQETYRRSTYLDNRIQHTQERLVALSIDEVIRAFEHVPAIRAPIHFLFHTSFCCSTLLARALESPGHTLVLREPWIFFQMSSIKARMESAGEWQRQGPALIDLMLTLLNKKYEPDEHIVIKPSNLANNIIDEVLTNLPDSRGILLYSNLKEFLISNLKKDDETKKKIPRLATEAASLIRYDESFPEIVPAQLPHLRAAAVFWHAQMLHFMGLLVRWPERLRTLQSQLLLEKPAEELRAVADWLRLILPGDHFNHVINGNTWSSHAKDPRYKYGVEFRQNENRAIIENFGADIEDALSWASPLLEKRPVTDITNYALELS
jgi:hypothetical protein